MLLWDFVNTFIDFNKVKNEENMKKILFITLGHLSVGEFTIAFEFCKGLPQDEFDICFLTSDRGVRYLKENNIKYVCLEKANFKEDSKSQLRNQKLIDSLMKQFQPDYVIASDIYTLWYSIPWTGFDLNALKAYGVQVGSFDSYEFASTNFVQDYYGGYNVAMPDYINQCDFVIRYCPINKVKKSNPTPDPIPTSAPDPIPTSEINVKYTYLFKEKVHLTEKQRRDFKQKFRPNNEKVILMTSSNWESLNVTRLPALANLMKWIPKIMLNYISQLNEKITVIHVGPFSYQTIFMNGNLTYYHYPYMEAEIFDEHLACSDLYLTTNIVSSTLVKSIYANVPAIVLQNSKIINFTHLKEQLKKMPSWYSEMASEVKIAYPFRLFPFGWHSFLKPLLEDNEYLDTFIQSGLFQNMKTVNTLRTYLFEESKRAELIEKQNSYISKMNQLPLPKEVIDSLVT